MAEQIVDNLLKAIKADNADLFRRLTEGTAGAISYCYGRFPILSLCYLYRSRKIIDKFSNELNEVTKYTLVGEDAESYRKFKALAKKSLRLYVYNVNVVTPLEMLAIMDEQLLLENEFNKNRRTRQEADNITSVYSLTHHREAAVDDNRLKIKRKRLPGALQCLVVATIICLSCFIVALSGTMAAQLPANFGTGSEKSPIKISSSTQLNLLLGDGSKNYSLENDITIENAPTPYKLTGTLNGNGNTIYLKGTRGAELFTKFTGTLKNINFVFEDINISLTENFALLTKKNSGTIENTKITVNGDCSKPPENTENFYLSCAVGENHGTINNLTLTADVTAESNGSGDSFLTGIAYYNYGAISNCIITENSRFIGKTIDVSAFVFENTATGVIKNSVNNANVRQENSFDLWSPNVVGFAFKNTGTIESCVNKGEIEVKLTTTTYSAAYAAGIAISNAGTILNCENLGKIIGTAHSDGTADKSFIYGAGISLYTVKDTWNSSVENCVNNGTVSIYATGNVGIYAAGIMASNIATVINCRNTAEIIANYDDVKSTSVTIGGICAVNNFIMTKNKNTGKITALSKAKEPASTEFELYYAVAAGGIAGFSGGYRNTLTDNCINESEINVTSESTAYVFIGGIIGINNGGLLTDNGGTKNCISVSRITTTTSADGVKLFIGGIASFFRTKDTNAENNYFIGGTGIQFGIATNVSITLDKGFIFGAGDNYGCAETAADKIRDLEVYWE